VIPDVTSAIAAAAAALPVIETARLRLRGLEPADAPAMFDYASDPELTRHVIFTTHQSPAESRQVIDRLIAENAAGTILMWGVTLRDDGGLQNANGTCQNGAGRLVGTCGFGHLWPAHARAELGYVLGRGLWGRGLMTGAVRAVIDFGFETLGLNRIDARCFVANVASARVMEKAGMRFEGILREQIHAKGAFQDLKSYSVLRRDRRG
jgi:ribosomal-protein-alanine N-acetyltransferase